MIENSYVLQQYWETKNFQHQKVRCLTAILTVISEKTYCPKYLPQHLMVEKKKTLHERYHSEVNAYFTHKYPVEDVCESGLNRTETVKERKTKNKIQRTRRKTNTDLYKNTVSPISHISPHLKITATSV